MGAKNAETVITGYEQASKDAKEMLRYLSTIKDPSELETNQLPSLVKNLENTNSAVSQKYISTAQIVGGGVASAVGVSLSSSAFAGGLGMAAMGGLGVAGIAGVGAVPILGWFAIPVIAIPLAMKLMNDAKVKKYIKANKADMQKDAKDMERQRNRLLGWLKTLQDRAAELDEKIAQSIESKYSDFKKKAKKLAKDVSIQIDDCLNADTNKRILQYNEVILNQYRLQKELEEKVEFLFDEYNEMLKQKKELERQVECLIKLLNAMGCPEAVINQALSGNGG